MKYLQSKSVFEHYLKIYENFQSEEEVKKICKKYDIMKWTINSDGLVDVDGDVNFHTSTERYKGIDLTESPLKFGHVSGDFDCASNQLTSLEGCPQSVGGDFSCVGNKLLNLVGSPRKVEGAFHCGHNELISLEGAPEYVGGPFYCTDNNITTLEYGPQLVDDNFYCFRNPISVVWNLISIDKDKWNKDIVDLLNDYDCIRGTDIIIDRFNSFLEEIGKPGVDFVEGYNNI